MIDNRSWIEDDLVSSGRNSVRQFGILIVCNGEAGVEAADPNEEVPSKAGGI